MVSIGKYEYARVNKSMPCPVCGKTKYCMVSVEGDYVICTKVSEGSIKHYSSYNGWLHGGKNFIRKEKIVKTKTYQHDKEAVLKKYYQYTFLPSAMTPLAKNLGCSTTSLADMGVGRKGMNFCFPMYNENLDIIGVKIRNIKGKKWCIPGSKLGIYVPSGIMLNSTIIICEGESDTAIALSTGMNAIGRASASTCGNILKKFTNELQLKIIFADNDKTGLGLKEAHKLAESLGNAIVVMNKKYKDLREWVLSNDFVSLNHTVEHFTEKKYGTNK